MGELGIVQHPPLGEEAVQPILQWAHTVDSPSTGPLQVRLANGTMARVRQFARAELPSGASVLLAPSGTPAVVLETNDRGRTYKVRTRSATISGVPSEELWPQPGAMPLPGALDAVCACARTLLHIHSNAVLGIRTHSAARLRVLWALERFLAASEGDGLSGATWVDASLLPHQLAAVAQVLTSPSIRHLLADEVGLGKTIEAIMLWTALRAQDPQLRTVFAVPRTLVPQWCFEVQRRGERRAKASWYEGLPRIFVADATGAYGVLDAPEPGRPIITEHSAFEHLTDLPIELLVVDESHLLNAKQRQAVDKISARVKHLLLLTGTPRDARRRTGVRARATSEELSPFLWALRVVDPKISPDADPSAISQLLEDALELGVLMRRGASGDSAAIAEFVRRAAGLLKPDAAVTPASPTEADLIELGRRVSRATIFERVVRTRRRNVSGEILCERQLELTRIEPRAEELAVLRQLEDATAEEAEDGVSEERSRRRAASSLKAVAGLRNLPSCTREAISGIGQTDSKLEALCDLLGELWSQDPSRKVVLRAAYAETRRTVFERIRSLLLDSGLRESSERELEAWSSDNSIGPVALLQESQDSIIDLLRRLSGAKDKRPTELDLRSTMLAQLRSFENFHEGGACLLVANDVAGTGLNLQLASDLVLYDVPWRPQLAEQWIGRLDRLGRRGANPVRIHVLSHPGAPDWELIQLYTALGVFGDGFHLPPEVGTKVDRLIDRADAGQIRWGQAIAEARALLEQTEKGENDDVLLDALEPDRELGAALAARAFDHSGGGAGPPCSIEVLESLREVGFAMERSPERGTFVQLTMARDLLALREIRQVLRPPRPTARRRPGQGTDPLAAPPHLNIDLERLPFGAALRHRPSQFFSPQHPLIGELRQELDLEAGGRFGTFELTTPPDLEPLVGSWIACALTRTFPPAAAATVLWGSRATHDLQDEELLRICEVVESGLARAVNFVFPPRSQGRGFIAGVQAGRLRLTDRELGHKQVEPLLRLLASARPAAQPPDAIDVALAELERRVSVVTDVNTDALSRYLRGLEEFIAHRRRDLLGRREKSHRDWRSRAKEGGGNVGFEKIAAREEASLRRAEEVFDHLARVPADANAIAREATRPRLVVAALILVKGRR